jgi:acetylornithine/succinyldiaminopimelate/putrescine aminotransferase
LALYCKGLLRKGLLSQAPHPDCLRFMPASTVTPVEIAEMAAKLDLVERRWFD